MLKDMNGKIAVVTGGASGIGRGIAARLIGQGMQVVIADIEDGALQQTAQAIGAVGIRADVSDHASVQALADAVIARFGAVHLVCNNAGVGSTAAIADMAISDWQWMLGVNLWGVIHGVKIFLPLLEANAEGGHIVNTSSIGGLATMPGLGGYSVSKFAVVALTEALALELEAAGSRVGATVLCPGTVRTNIKNSTRNRPVTLGAGGLVDADLENSDFGAHMRWLEPEDVGDVVIEAVRRGDLYAFTHPEMGSIVLDRHDHIKNALDAAAAAAIATV
jgi:NAD(P)-dependent dehydrogenase (short-subunit alcohol dehydrogenase family)